VLAEPALVVLAHFDVLAAAPLLQAGASSPIVPVQIVA
jgi:hypothetical protein